MLAVKDADEEVVAPTPCCGKIQFSGHFQPLLNLMCDRLLEGPVILCDETWGQC
jgi:hypothetical protein